MQLTRHEKHNQIVSLLEEYLIHPEGKGLAHVYDHFFKYYNKAIENKYPDTAFANIEKFKDPIKNYFNSSYKKSLCPQKDFITTIGIDLPSYFTSNNPIKKTMMVCAMDPLPPPPDDFKKSNTDVAFGVPFDLIEFNREIKDSLKGNGPFLEMLSTEYNLYVTDIYKVFFRLIADKKYNTEIIDKKGNVVPFIISNTIPGYTDRLKKVNAKEIADLHSIIFANEIEIVQPDIILTLGNDARDKILLMDNQLNQQAKQKANIWETNPKTDKANFQHYNWNGENKINIISSPHISGAARGTLTQIFNNYNVVQEDRIENRATKKMAELLMNFIREKTII